MPEPTENPGEDAWSSEDDLLAQALHRLESSQTREREARLELSELESMAREWLADLGALVSRIEDFLNARSASEAEKPKGGESAARSTPADVLAKYAGPLHQGRREEVARHHFMRRIASGRIEDMLAAARDHECPEAVLRAIADNEDLPWGSEEVRDLTRAIAANPNAPVEFLRLLFDDPDLGEIRSVILANPRCPDDLRNSESV